MFLVLAGQVQAAGDSEFAQGVILFKQENYRGALEQFVAARDKGMDAPKLDYNIEHMDTFGKPVAPDSFIWGKFPDFSTPWLYSVKSKG